jgi:hypothetical protein
MYTIQIKNMELKKIQILLSFLHYKLINKIRQLFRAITMLVFFQIQKSLLKKKD